MSQHSDQKAAAKPQPKDNPNQPSLTELSPEELAKVSGGATDHKVSTSDITITKTTDKTSSSLF